MPEVREADQADDSVLVDGAPRRRQSGLTVAEVAGETLVYDLRTHHAHCLNATTAFVWQQCDGERSAAAIAAALEREHGVPAGSGAVWLALEQLDKADLLDRTAQRSGVNLSRRLVLRTVAAAGLAATVLPALSSITAPTASAAGSCPPNQVLCGTNCCTVGTTTCINGACCANAQVCGTACCVVGTTTCVGGACCPNARVCGGACCTDGFVCIPGTTQCCPTANVCQVPGDGSVCCATGHACCAGTCCPLNVACINNTCNT